MGVRRINDLIAWQLAVEFKEAVYKLVKDSESARRDFRYRDQIFDAIRSTASNVNEGFHRYGRREFIRFLGIARASHAEAEDHVRDGITCGYFTAETAAPALLLAKRCSMAILRLIQSLDR